MHAPVLLKEFLLAFSEKKIRFFVDGTMGAGGHAFALLEAHPEIEMLFGIDQDPQALQIAQETLQPYKHKITLCQGNFRNLSSLIPWSHVDGIFLDIGVSSMQLDRAEKGFSFTKDGPLDMRMDPSCSLTAAKIVNTYSEKELAKIFWEYGEESRANRASRAIVEARRKKKITTTFELCDVLKPVLTWGGRGRKKIHPMTLVFQALRIAVNDELNAIDEAISQAINLLSAEARFGVISFQSLEDRIVKEAFRKAAREQENLNLVTKKPIVPDESEVRANPRSRSAKMRFIERRA